MKIDARLLVRLYPRQWRERYGAEFEALVGDQVNWQAALDIGRAAMLQRLVYGAKLMEANRVPQTVGPMIGAAIGTGLSTLRRHSGAH